jgi:uncharacterized protein
MKAFLVLVLLYVGAFFLATQGASQSAVEAAQQTHSAGAAEAGSSIESAKEADIRSLMELVGARDAIQDATARGTEQFRENLIASVPDSDRGQQFVNAFAADYQKKLNPDEVTSQLVAIYDKHFTDEEIKGLLQFYGSPLGRKFAAEQPKITAEIQDANRAVSTQVAKDVLEDLPKEYLGINPKEPSIKAHPAVQAQPVKHTTQAPDRTQPESMASASQP